MVFAGIKLPDTTLVRDAVELSRSSLEPILFNHVMRSWLFGVLLSEGAEHTPDAELLAVAATLHDLGLTERSPGLIDIEKRACLQVSLAADEEHYLNRCCSHSSLAAACRTAQRKTLGYRCELVTAPDPILTEPVDEDPPHGGHKGGAAGEEDPIHFGGLNPGAPEQGIHAVLNRGQVFSDPVLELGPCNRNAQLDCRCTGCAITKCESADSRCDSSYLTFCTAWWSWYPRSP
jgi:hypothetical protein